MICMPSPAQTSWDAATVNPMFPNLRERWPAAFLAGRDVRMSPGQCPTAAANRRSWSKIVMGTRHDVRLVSE